MKFLTVFAAILAIAFGANSHWTLDQLSEALQNPNTNPSLVPILEQALDAYMTSMFAGESHQYISITTAPVDLNTWTLSELSEAIENPNTNPAILPYLENALDTLMTAVFTGEVQASSAQAAITIPALEISYWTLADVDQALMDPTTSPALIPYLEQALNQMMDNLYNGVQGAASIVLATPLETPTAVTPEVVIAPGVDVDPVQVVDTPVTPVQVVEAPVGPAIVTPVAVDSAPVAPAVSGSPLVQIIVNINQKESVAPEAVITPTPVAVPEGTEAFPNPRPPVPETVEHPAEEAFPNPRPPVPESVINPTPEVVPEPVIIAPDFNPIDDIMISPPEVNPIDVIAVGPEPDVNPIDVIAVGPEPDMNPIDVIAVGPEPDVNPIDVIAVVPGTEFNPIDTVAIAAPDVNPVDLLNPVVQPVVVIGGADFGPM